MKTSYSVAQIFPRAFWIGGNKVLLRPSTSSDKEYVPTIVRVHSSLAPLKVEMTIFAELIHSGADDPLGHDRLHAQLAFVLERIFIGNPAQELLYAERDSSESLHEWLASTKRTFLAANHFAKFRRFPDETIDSVFAPLFDTLAALTCSLNEALKSRTALWETHSLNTKSLPLQERFKLRFS